jgi:hypothetical protein
MRFLRNRRLFPQEAGLFLRAWIASESCHAPSGPNCAAAGVFRPRIQRRVRSTSRRSIAGLGALGIVACGGILGLNEDDPPNTSPSSNDSGADGGSTNASDGAQGADGPTSPSPSFCASKTSAALCVDFDDADAGARLPQIALVGGSKLTIIDGGVSAPHALLIDVPASPQNPAWAEMHTDVQLGTQKTITIEADLRLDAVNFSGVSPTHVLVVSFGTQSEPRYEVDVHPSGISLSRYEIGGAMDVAATGNIQVPIGSWLRLNLLIRLAARAAVLQIGSTIAQFAPGTGLTTDLTSIKTGPKVWVGSGEIPTAIGYDNFVVTLSP